MWQDLQPSSKRKRSFSFGEKSPITLVDAIYEITQRTGSGLLFLLFLFPRHYAYRVQISHQQILRVEYLKCLQDWRGRDAVLTMKTQIPAVYSHGTSNRIAHVVTPFMLTHVVSILNSEKRAIQKRLRLVNVSALSDARNGQNAWE
jgi:hypothetical protein